jgi:hypothetical protein
MKKYYLFFLLLGFKTIIANAQSNAPGAGNAFQQVPLQNYRIILGNTNAATRPTTAITVECWVKVTSNIQYGGIVCNTQDNASDEAGYYLVSKNDELKNIEFNLKTNNNTFTVPHTFTAIPQNTWAHVAGTYNGANIQLYINGILKSTFASTGNIDWVSVNPTRYTIGNYIDDDLTYPAFSGGIDEVRVWNIALSPAQIRDRMCQKITAADALFGNLVSYYNLDEASGTVAFDASTTANNGTFTNVLARATSGASIGNASANDYVNAVKTATITHASGENFTVTSSSGNPAGIHVFRMDEVPNTLNGLVTLGNSSKYFGVFQAEGTSPQYTATYNYNGNPFVTPATENELRLYKRTNNAVTGWSSTAAIPDEAANTITLTGQSTEYILAKVGGALPLRLISFTGSKQNNGALLQWKTENEINTSHFEIQKSSDGNNSTTIATANANNRSGINNYSFTDAQPITANNFYRLKQIDFDGRFTYSSILKIQFIEKPVFTIYPNPAVNGLSISGATAGSVIYLYDAAGKQLLQRTINAQSLTISMDSYAKGMYLLTYTIDGERMVQKIMKQ